MIVRVPMALCVTAERAHGSPEVGTLLARLDPPPEAHVAIAVWLMRAASHPPEPLRPWLVALPARFDCTLEWEESELDELQASPARKRGAAFRAWSAREHARVFSGVDVDFDASAARSAVDVQCGSSQIDDEGNISKSSSSGGLATGLAGPHQNSNGLWIGWPGDVRRRDSLCAGCRPLLKLQNA